MPFESSKNPCLVVRNLSCEKGSVEVFSNLSFSIAAGRSLCVTGTNGSGKTTLLKALASVQEISQGSIVIEHDQVSYLGHSKAIKQELTVYENLKFWSALGRTRPVSELLERFHLQKLSNVPVHFLSEGQQKKLSLACSLQPDRQIWLLDEPYTSLDSAGKMALTELIIKHNADNGVVVLSSHSVELENHCMSLAMDDFVPSARTAN